MMYNTDAVSLRIFKKSQLWKDLMINTRAFFPVRFNIYKAWGPLDVESYNTKGKTN